MSLPSLERPLSRPAKKGSGLGPWLLRHLLPGLACGRLTIETPDGRHLVLQGRDAGPDAAVVLHRWSAVHRLLTAGDLGFADAYIDGDWSTPDLLALLDLAVRNIAAIDRRLQAVMPVRLVRRLSHWRNANTPKGSRRNISAHYDLGNDFYRLWLDPLMIYSSALYRASGQTLEQAQQEKLERIVELLSPVSGDRILEIGSGWGALALRLAGQGNEVTAVTLSTEQVAWAQARAEESGLSGRCRFLLQDYRSLNGSFDRIVSIEMLEAVGETYWPVYFAKLRELLAKQGTAVLQVITIDQARFDGYRRTPDFIQRRVFPGGMLPTQDIIRREADAAGLELVGSETFGQSYALTLEEWRRRVLRAWPRIRALDADPEFGRLWDYYLCYCAAGFRAGVIDVGLYVLRHNRRRP